MTKYREAFSWTRSVDDFVKWHVTETPLLNVCAGRTPWGDVTLDLHEPADVQGRWDALPFERDSFGAVFADPPWDSGHKGSASRVTCPIHGDAPICGCRQRVSLSGPV